MLPDGKMAFSDSKWYGPIFFSVPAMPSQWRRYCFLAMDYRGPSPEASRGNKYVLVIPIKDQKANIVTLVWLAISYSS